MSLTPDPELKQKFVTSNGSVGRIADREALFDVAWKGAKTRKIAYQRAEELLWAYKKGKVRGKQERKEK